MVFEEEINQALYPNRYFVENKKTPISIDKLINAAQELSPNATLSSVKIYPNPLKTVEISFSSEVKAGSKEKAKPNLITFVNPYTATVIEVLNKKESFFFKVEMLHRFLLGKKGGIGQYIMGYSASFFLFILITGIILWWPKTKSILLQRLKIKWDSKRQRIIHDLHVVTGFYTSVFLLVIILTGLVMSFKWLNNGIFKITASTVENPKPPQSTSIVNQPRVSFDKLNYLIKNKVKEAEYYTLKIPQDSSDVFTLSILNKGRQINKSNIFYVDQYNGNIIGELPYSAKNLGQRIRSYIKPIHTGELFGMPSKIINFLICLLTLSFPITGVMIWLNRLKKSKNSL